MPSLRSLGCVTCQLLSGQPPFKGGSDYLTFKRVIKGLYLMPEGMPPAAASLVEQLLVLDANERLGGAVAIDEPEARRHAAVRSHAWFSERLECPQQLHGRYLSKAPIPVASLKELCAPLVGERMAQGGWHRAAMRGPPVREWPEPVRRQVVFELTKRGELQNEELRATMLLGPAPVTISDDELIREDREGALKEGEGAKEGVENIYNPTSDPTSAAEGGGSEEDGTCADDGVLV